MSNLELSLKNPEHREILVKMREDAESSVEVQNLTGIPARTLRDFYAGNSWKEWWAEYNAAGGSLNIPEKDGPKVLFIDVETAPMLAWVWGRFKQFVNQAQVEQEGKYLLSYAARWMGTEHVMSDNLSNSTDVASLDPDVRCNDKALAEATWKLYDDADLICGHNIRRFDTKVLNTAWKRHGLPPPSPYKEIDTLLILRGNFALSSNKLGDACEFFGIGGKVETGGFDLWKRCMAGDKEAFIEMERYNVGDIADTLEPLYMEIRAWDKRHPSFAPYFEGAEPRCVCGSTDLIDEGKTYKTNQSEFKTYRCGDCGRSGNRGKKNLKTKEQMAAAIIPC